MRKNKASYWQNEETALSLCAGESRGWIFCPATVTIQCGDIGGDAKPRGAGSLQRPALTQNEEGRPAGAPENSVLVISGTSPGLWWKCA